MVYSYLRGGSRFLLWICGSGEVGELLWRGDLEFYTGAVGFSEFKWSGESYRYWYGGTGQLRSSAILQKGGRKVSRVQVDDTSLTEYQSTDHRRRR